MTVIDINLRTNYSATFPRCLFWISHDDMRVYGHRRSPRLGTIRKAGHEAVFALCPPPSAHNRLSTIPRSPPQ